MKTHNGTDLNLEETIYRAAELYAEERFRELDEEECEGRTEDHEGSRCPGSSKIYCERCLIDALAKAWRDGGEFGK